MNWTKTPVELSEKRSGAADNLTKHGPQSYSSAAEVAEVAVQAAAAGQYFARKFRPVPEVISALAAGAAAARKRAAEVEL